MCTRSACRPTAATGSRSTARWREQRGRRSAGSWTEGAGAHAGARQSKRRRGQNQRIRSSDVARRRCSGRSNDRKSLPHEGFDRQQHALSKPSKSVLFAFFCRLRIACARLRQQQHACEACGHLGKLGDSPNSTVVSDYKLAPLLFFFSTNGKEWSSS